MEFSHYMHVAQMLRSINHWMVEGGIFYLLYLFFCFIYLSKCHIFPETNQLSVLFKGYEECAENGCNPFTMNGILMLPIFLGPLLIYRQRMAEDPW